MERFWLSRARWRLRGGMLWPTFVVVTVLDGLVLHWLPPVRFGFSEVGLPVIAGVIVATFGNLFLVGALAPFLARARARARPVPAGTPPEAFHELRRDRIAVLLVVAGFFGVLAAGLASIPLIAGETDERNRASRALAAYVQGHAPAEIRRNNDQGVVETERLADGYYRSCIPFADRDRHWCVFVDANRTPVEIVKDPSEEPNGPQP